MANKRDFKKYVDAVSASACEAMMDTLYNVKGVDKEAINKAIEQVLGATAAARANANIFFDKGAKAFGDPKEYAKAKEEFFTKLFDKITADYSKQLEEAIKLFNSAIPQDVKEQHKVSVTA